MLSLHDALPIVRKETKPFKPDIVFENEALIYFIITLFNMIIYGLILWVGNGFSAAVRNHDFACHSEKPTFCSRIRLRAPRSEEHTSELQSLMRISYAVFRLQKKKQT